MLSQNIHVANDFHFLIEKIADHFVMICYSNSYIQFLLFFLTLNSHIKSIHFEYLVKQFPDLVFSVAICCRNRE